MAIIKETIGNLTRRYSDSNFLIKKVGTEELYAEAYDVQSFEYEETDIPMEIPEDTNDLMSFDDLNYN